MAERLGECQEFINKVSEIRFIKVRQRQINKFNHLVIKKEGNITIANAVNNTRSITNAVNRQAPCNPTPAFAHLPPGEGSNSLPGAVHLPSEDNSSSQAIVLLPSGEENNSSQAASLLPHRERNSSPQSSSSTHAGQGNNPPGQLGKVIGTPQAQVNPVFPGSQHHLPGRQPHIHTPSRPTQGSSNEEPNPKWVINLSNKPLTPAQRSVLAKGPNFAVTPRQPPNLEYITAIEAACTKLSQQDAEELMADINRVLRSSHPPKPNLTKVQNAALRELKRDRDCIVLTADKGVAMVVMDKQDYISKANQLLNQNTYKVISKDPTNTIKNKLINILKGIKTKTRV